MVPGTPEPERSEQANRASPTEPPVELDGEAQRAEFGVPDSGSGLNLFSYSSAAGPSLFFIALCM